MRPGSKSPGLLKEGSRAQMETWERLDAALREGQRGHVWLVREDRPTEPRALEALVVAVEPKAVKVRLEQSGSMVMRRGQVMPVPRFGAPGAHYGYRFEQEVPKDV